MMTSLLNSFRSNFRIIPTILKIVRCVSAPTPAQTLPEVVAVPPKEESVFARVVKKKEQRRPFMKNVFLGEFDSEILGFPESLSNEQLKKLNDKISVVNHFVTKIDEVQYDDSVLTNDVVVQLTSMNLFGLQAPEIVGGQELTETENYRMLEALAKCTSLAMSLIIHQYFGVQSIMKVGSDDIKNKYLAPLSTGKNIAAFCLLEQDNLDPSLMKTQATKRADGSLVLNGTKAWVVNGSQGNLYIVLALTDPDSSEKERMSLLVVEKDFGGISVRPCYPCGLKGADISTVTFKNTPVPKENILGKGGEGMQTITKLLSGFRLSTGPCCISIMRKLIDKFSKSALQTKHGSRYISDSDFIHEKIAEINLDLYAVESMTYMVAGLLDRYEKHDCELESAIVKVFSSEKCLESVLQCMKLSGPPAYMEQHWLNKLYNDALGHGMMNETNGSLRMIIALLGLQHAGMGLNSNIKKFRNPFFFPGFVIKKIWEKRRQEADNPKLDLHLENYVHPSLIHAARWLEYCVYRLQHATETLLIRHGPDIVNQHMELRRLADVAMNVFAMTAVISRASRSYCIGLRNADCEIFLANAFCLNARDLIKRLVIELSNGPYGTNDINYQKIASRAFEYNGYFAEHVLTKNF